MSARQSVPPFGLVPLTNKYIGLSAQCPTKRNSVTMKKCRNVGTDTLYYSVENSRHVKLNFAIAFFIRNSSNESKIIINIYKIIRLYMLRHQMCHPQGACFVTSLNYISTIAALLQLYSCNLAR